MANKEVHIGDDWYLGENNDGDLIFYNSNTGKVVKAIDKETGAEDKKGNSVNNLLSNASQDQHAKVKVFIENGITYAVDKSEEIASGSSSSNVIQSAIDKYDKDTRVVITDGVYKVDNTLVITSKENFTLEGIKGAVIKPTGDFDAIRVGSHGDTGKKCVRTKVKGFEIDGSNQTAGGETEDIPHGISVRTSQAIVEKNYIHDCGGEAIFAWASITPTIVRENHTKNTRGGWASIHAHGNNHASYIINNHIEDSQVGALRHGAIISGNFVDGCEGVGIYGGNSNQARSIIANNRIENSSNGGIVTFGIGAKVINNTLEGCGNPNIQMGANKAIVQGNYLNGNMDTHNGIRSQGADYCSIQGNIIENFKNQGVKIIDVKYSNVIGNILIQIGNVGTEAILLGTDGGNNSKNIVARNIIDTALEDGIVEEHTGTGGTFADNLIEDNQIYNITGSEVIKLADSTVVRGNKGWVTENQGIATITSGSTSVTVNHGLDETPSASDIQVTLNSELGTASCYYVDPALITSSSFDIVVDADPTQDVDFSWEVKTNP